MTGRALHIAAGRLGERGPVLVGEVPHHPPGHPGGQHARRDVLAGPDHRASRDQGTSADPGPASTSRRACWPPGCPGGWCGTSPTRTGPRSPIRPAAMCSARPVIAARPGRVPAADRPRDPGTPDVSLPAAATRCGRLIGIVIRKAGNIPRSWPRNDPVGSCGAGGPGRNIVDWIRCALWEGGERGA